MIERLDDQGLDGIVTLVRAGAGEIKVEGGTHSAVLVPEGYEIHELPELKFNKHQPRPERIVGHPTVDDPASFIEYYTLFSDVNSRVFADEQRLRIQAILDYHGAMEGGPRWGEHRLSLVLRYSVEWEAWLALNGKHMTQQQFMEFLEQRADDVTTPTPATMREIASDLRGHTEVEFGSGINSANGQTTFKYTETVRGKVGGGELEVPNKFTITIPAFVAGEEISMDAWLGWRQNQGKLAFFYTLIGPEKVIHKAFMVARAAIATGLTVTIINGTP